MALMTLAAWATLSLLPQVPASCVAGLAQFQKMELAGAQDLLWDCVEQGAADRTPGLDLALTYRELKNYEAGLRRAKPALQKFPKNIDVLYVTAFLYFRLGNNAQSMILLSKADGIDREDWRVHQLFALNYAKFNMPDSATSELKRAMALAPSNAELPYQLARLYFTQGKYPESIAASHQALAILPEYPEVFNNLGLAYEGSGDTARAIASFQRAIALNEKHGRRDEWPLIDYGMFYLRQGAPETARPLLEQAWQFNPQSAKASYELGRTMRALNRDDEAERYFAKALELDPNYASACLALAPLVRRHGDLRRAAELLARFQILRQKETAEHVGLESIAAR